MQLPVGGDAVVELSCDKDATSWYASGPGGDARDPRNPDYPCPRSPLASFHTNGINDLGGCALSLAYKSDANDVQPEDLVIFSVQQTCVWNLHTHFEIPADMPPCPNGKYLRMALDTQARLRFRAEFVHLSKFRKESGPLTDT